MYYPEPSIYSVYFWLKKYNITFFISPDLFNNKTKLGIELLLLIFWALDFSEIGIMIICSPPSDFSILKSEYSIFSLNRLTFAALNARSPVFCFSNQESIFEINWLARIVF